MVERRTQRLLSAWGSKPSLSLTTCSPTLHSILANVFPLPKRWLNTTAKTSSRNLRERTDTSSPSLASSLPLAVESSASSRIWVPRTLFSTLISLRFDFSFLFLYWVAWKNGRQIFLTFICPYFLWPFQGRMKLFGTIVYPKSRYLTLQFPRGGKNVMCEDCFDNMVCLFLSSFPLFCSYFYWFFFVILIIVIDI